MRSATTAAIVVVSTVIFGTTAISQPRGSKQKRPPGPSRRDAILQWNSIALQTVVDDHSGTFGPPEQGGPTRSSRALAILHIAMYDAVNAIDGSFEPYIPVTSPTDGASMDAAVAQAAHDALVALYPDQTEALDRKLDQALRGISRKRGRDEGALIGFEAAMNILAERDADGSVLGDFPIYPLTGDPPLPGEHVPDLPRHPLALRS